MPSCFGVRPAQAHPLHCIPLQGQDRFRTTSAAENPGSRADGLSPRVGGSLGSPLPCFCPPPSQEMGDSLLVRALEGGAANRTVEEEEEEEGAGELPQQQGLPQARRSSKFLKRPQPLFQGLR